MDRESSQEPFLPSQQECQSLLNPDMAEHTQSIDIDQNMFTYAQSTSRHGKADRPQVKKVAIYPNHAPHFLVSCSTTLGPCRRGFHSLKASRGPCRWCTTSESGSSQAVCRSGQGHIRGFNGLARGTILKHWTTPLSHNTHLSSN